MKNYKRIGLMAVALLFVFSSFGIINEVKGQASETAAILQLIENNRVTMDSLRCNVEMEKYDNQINDTTKFIGKVVYAPTEGKKANFKLDWSKPIPESLAVVNGKYVLYRPNIKQAIIGSADPKKLGAKNSNPALGFISMSKEELKANFTTTFVKREELEKDLPTFRIKLIPKIATDYQYAEAWIDGNGMPIRVRVVEKHNDVTTVRLRNLQKNVKLKTEDFVINYPESTKEVKG